MRHKIVTMAVLLGVLALSAVLAPQALALPELLGQAEEFFSGQTTAANPTWETTKKEKIACKEMTMGAIQESDALGTFHMHLIGCLSSGFKCNTEGDVSSIILALGDFHYVFDMLGAELGVAILFLPEEQTIKCTALVTLKLRGTLLCLILGPLTSSTTHEFHCTAVEGKPTETRWWNDEGIEQNALLLVSKNGGTFIETGAQILGSTTFSVPVAFMSE